MSNFSKVDLASKKRNSGDVKIGSLFFATVQKDSPNTKLWLYSVWPNNQDPKYQAALHEMLGAVEGWLRMR